MEWFLPLLAGLIGVLGLFASAPTHRRIAVATALVIVLSAGWQASAEFYEGQIRDQIRQRAHRRLSGQMNKFNSLLADMIQASSDGWLPTAQPDFYSQRTADQICRHLDPRATAWVIPDRPWWRWIEKISTETRDLLSEVQADQGQFLDPEFLAALHDFERSLMMSMWTQLRLIYHVVGEQEGARIRTLCSGVEEQIQESLQQISVLHGLIEDGGAKYGVEPRRYWERMNSDDARMGDSRLE